MIIDPKTFSYLPGTVKNKNRSKTTTKPRIQTAASRSRQTVVPPGPFLFLSQIGALFLILTARDLLVFVALGMVDVVLPAGFHVRLALGRFFLLASCHVSPCLCFRAKTDVVGLRSPLDRFFWVASFITDPAHCSQATSNQRPISFRLVFSLV